MPVEVPKEPKNYTTVYDNFKGVDFTNDASNVYRRRSPTGVNMLPDLDGRPYKRTGWDIKFSKQDFITAAGVVGVTEIIPLRTHYFSYGGHDFIMVFNSLGVFWIRDDSDAPKLATLWENGEEGVFPPFALREYEDSPTPREVQLTADPNKAFFFEGQGISGFYVFVESDLYRFCDVGDDKFCFVKVAPKVPIVLIGATPRTCVGSDGQALNMLTEKRTIEYFGDGTALYTIPSDAASIDDIQVELLDPDSATWGVVEYDDQNYPWTFTDGYKITFTSGKPEASVIGNVRITYTPENSVTHTVVPDAETKKIKYTISEVVTYTQDKEVLETYLYNKKKKKWVLLDKEPWDDYPWVKKSTVKSNKAVTLKFTDIFKNDNIKIMSNYPGSGYSDKTSNFTIKFNAYAATAEVQAKTALRDQAISSVSKVEKIGAWGKTGSTTLDSGTDDTGDRYKDVLVEYRRTKTVTRQKEFTIYGVYDRAVETRLDPSLSLSRDAFSQCRKTLNFGNDIYNQVFISSSTADNYRNRAWYCAANDPSYFPDTNYIEVGSDDKSIMGLQKVGSYLGIIKMGSGIEASVYLAYPTSFEEDSTYAVKQSVSGVGAISNGAFNILNEEPLFLSGQGVMGINVNETDVNKQIRNRSFYINKRLTAEADLENAISFVHAGLYYLAINDHCYVLDGSQKTSWANEKTNLQYECYYLDNIPAQCFAKMGTTLYFSDHVGNLCFFKAKDDAFAYADAYLTREADWLATSPPENDEFNLADLGGASDEYAYLLDSDDDYLCVYPEGTTEYKTTNRYNVGDFVHYGGRVYACVEAISVPEEWTPSHWDEQDPDRILVMAGQADVNATVSYFDDYYTIIEVYNVTDEQTGEETGEVRAVVSSGVPIYAEWSTIADDDDMVHFFKNLRKKGCVISLLPGEGSYIQVFIRPDEKTPVDLGYIEAGVTELPADLIIKKKIKKYKRLQFIIRDDWYNDGFALDQIIKTYTVGNYSKNRK